VFLYRIIWPCLAMFLFGCMPSLSAPALQSESPSLATVEPMNESANLQKPRNLHVIDLTHPISASSPTWDAETGEYHYEKLTSVAKDGYFSGAFRISEHFGTHIDAPAHFIDGGMCVDRLPPERLILPALVIDVRKEVAENPDYELTVQKIEDWERQGRITPGCAVLLLTGWGQRFSDSTTYRNPDQMKHMHFPGYSSQAAKYLVEDRRVAALGIDTLSIDPGRSETFPVHKIALAHDVYLIENLNNLDLLPPRGILLFCGPLPIQGGSGSPARVLAIVE